MEVEVDTTGDVPFLQKRFIVEFEKDGEVFAPRLTVHILQGPTHKELVGARTNAGKFEKTSMESVADAIDEMLDEIQNDEISNHPVGHKLIDAFEEIDRKAVDELGDEYETLEA